MPRPAPIPIPAFRVQIRVSRIQRIRILFPTHDFMFMFIFSRPKSLTLRLVSISLPHHNAQSSMFNVDAYPPFPLPFLFRNSTSTSTDSTFSLFVFLGSDAWSVGRYLFVRCAAIYPLSSFPSSWCGGGSGGGEGGSSCRWEQEQERFLSRILFIISFHLLLSTINPSRTGTHLSLPPVFSLVHSSFSLHWSIFFCAGVRRCFVFSLYIIYHNPLFLFEFGFGFGFFFVYALLLSLLFSIPESDFRASLFHGQFRIPPSWFLASESFSHSRSHLTPHRSSHPTHISYLTRCITFFFVFIRSLPTVPHS